MSCCGRGAGQPRNPDSGAQSRGFVSKRLVAPVTGRAAIRSTAFEYAGVNAIVVTGPMTGAIYRFAGRGARVTVHAADAPSLLGVPGLKPVS